MEDWPEGDGSELDVAAMAGLDAAQFEIPVAGVLCVYRVHDVH